MTTTWLIVYHYHVSNVVKIALNKWEWYFFLKKEEAADNEEGTLEVQPTISLV